ncbi:MAG: nuclear transport factor 2 family protein [Candidatus Binataceae bacterium]
MAKSAAALLGVALILCAGRAPAQQARTEQQLIKLESDWAEAARKGDAVAIGKILDDKFVSTDWNGEVQNQEQYVASLAQSRVESLTLEELSPRVSGDCAVVTGREKIKLTYRGKEVGGEFRFTDVFVKRGKLWKAIATHQSRIAP